MANEKAEIEKLDLDSMDIAEEKRNELLRLFPEVRTEGGKIDFEKLKLTLGQAIDVGKERFGMNWPGKAECFKTIQTPSQATLLPLPKKSVHFDNSENLIIEGDNLEVLKLLQKAYLGQVKMIYIDPPYNTGKEFIYPDNFSESLQTYLEYTGQVDAHGKRFGTNTEAEGRFHSNWLRMMMPRLYLARNLLSDAGAIFISIDDNEKSNLKFLCDSIFGEENLLGVFIWKRRQNPDSRNQSNVSPDHEYILVYAKDLQKSKFAGVEIDTSKYQNPDNDPRGPWASIDLSGLATKEQRPNLHYDIIDPKTGNAYPPNPNRGWSKSKENVLKMIEEGRILFPKNPSGRPREKKFIKDLRSDTTGFSTWLDSDEVGFTTNGTREVSDIFGAKIFDFPKPTSLLRLFIKQFTVDGDIILDFFAGSGSTGDSILKQIAEDGINRRFILVQLPEPCDEGTEARKAGYKTIADIAEDRVKKVIEKMIIEQNELKEKKEFFSFKVFQLAQSNFKSWNQETSSIDGLTKQLELHVDHVNPERTADDILYEILLKSGFPLTTKVETQKFGKQTVYSIAGGMLLVCLEDNLTLDLIKHIAEQKPERVVCLDQGFANNDQLKANAVQIFRTKGIASFKTV